jgi:hypothetical protein
MKGVEDECSQRMKRNVWLRIRTKAIDMKIEMKRKGVIMRQCVRCHCCQGSRFNERPASKPQASLQRE